MVIRSSSFSRCGSDFNISQKSNSAESENNTLRNEHHGSYVRTERKMKVLFLGLYDCQDLNNNAIVKKNLNVQCWALD